MQQRRGTAAQWISTNSGNGPILSAGEIGFESDTNKFKIGDGINHWVDLTYFTDTESITTVLGTKASSSNPEFNVSSVIGFPATGGFDSTTQFTSFTDDGTSEGATHLRVTGTLFDGDYAISGISEGVVTLVAPGVPEGLVSAFPPFSMFINSEILYIGPKTISATELSYLDGVTSNIQTQLDSKLPGADINMVIMGAY